MVSVWLYARPRQIYYTSHNGDNERQSVKIEKKERKSREPVVGRGEKNSRDLECELGLTEWVRGDIYEDNFQSIWWKRNRQNVSRKVSNLKEKKIIGGNFIPNDAF